MKLLSVYIRGEHLGFHLDFGSGLLGFQIFGVKDFIFIRVFLNFSSGLDNPFKLFLNLKIYYIL